VTLQPISESGKGQAFADRERRLSHRVGCKGFADAFVLETGYLFAGRFGTSVKPDVTSRPVPRSDWNASPRWTLFSC
jgi:hypothetical protein